ncbi:MAG: extracellular catalytic domain type 1 short-chain-length polyhydroxyalkanoate depolymerase [Terriglobales bacterium]
MAPQPVLSNPFGTPAFGWHGLKVPAFEQATITVDDLERTFNVHVPADLDAKQPVPLVILLHGGGGTASDKLANMAKTADKHGFILVLPQGLEKHWNDGRQVGGKHNYDDVNFISKLIDYLSGKYNIDRTRVYATGISNGGFFSAYLAAKLPDKIAAVAPVAATLTKEEYDTVTPPQPVSVLYIVGTDDPLVPFKGGEMHIGPIKRGFCSSAQDALAYWVKADGCNATPLTSEMPLIAAADRTSVTCEQFTGGKNGTEVVAYIIHGGGHTWPCGLRYLPRAIVGRVSHQLDANETIWRFFSQHHL